MGKPVYLRLWSVRPPEKTAVVSVDLFRSASETTLAWIQFERLTDGRVLYSLRPEASGGAFRGAAVTVREAVERVTLLVSNEYGVVANPIGFDHRDGLDNMGLWTALGDDSGLAQE